MGCGTNLVHQTWTMAANCNFFAWFDRPVILCSLGKPNKPKWSIRGHQLTIYIYIHIYIQCIYIYIQCIYTWDTKYKYGILSIYLTSNLISKWDGSPNVTCKHNLFSEQKPNEHNLPQNISKFEKGIPIVSLNKPYSIAHSFITITCQHIQYSQITSVWMKNFFVVVKHPILSKTLHYDQSAAAMMTAQLIFKKSLILNTPYTKKWWM